MKPLPKTKEEWDAEGKDHYRAYNRGKPEDMRIIQHGYRDEKGEDHWLCYYDSKTVYVNGKEPFHGYPADSIMEEACRGHCINELNTLGVNFGHLPNTKTKQLRRYLDKNNKIINEEL